MLEVFNDASFIALEKVAFTLAVLETFVAPSTGDTTVPVGATVSVGVVSIVQARLAGLWSVLPAASMALTLKLCDPSARPEYDLGDWQEANVPPSRLHSKVEPDSEAGRDLRLRPRPRTTS